MADSSSSEIELGLYEEIINMNYSTPMASVSSPLSHDKNESSMSHFNGPIVSSSESAVVGTSTMDSSLPSRDSILDIHDHLVGSFQEPRLLMHPDGNLRAALNEHTIRCVSYTWAEVYLRSKWHLEPSSRLATIWAKNCVGLCPFSRWSWVGLLHPGLPPYQVAP